MAQNFKSGQQFGVAEYINSRAEDAPPIMSSHPRASVTALSTDGRLGPERQAASLRREPHWFGRPTVAHLHDL